MIYLIYIIPTDYFVLDCKNQSKSDIETNNKKTSNEKKINKIVFHIENCLVLSSYMLSSWQYDSITNDQNIEAHLQIEQGARGQEVKKVIFYQAMQDLDIHSLLFACKYHSRWWLQWLISCVQLTGEVQVIQVQSLYC